MKIIKISLCITKYWEISIFRVVKKKEQSQISCVLYSHSNLYYLKPFAYETINIKRNRYFNITEIVALFQYYWHLCTLLTHCSLGALTWTNVDEVLWCHMALLSHIVFSYGWRHSNHTFNEMSLYSAKTHLPLVLNICISELGQHWFR